MIENLHQVNNRMCRPHSNPISRKTRHDRDFCLLAKLGRIDSATRCTRVGWRKVTIQRVSSQRLRGQGHREFHFCPTLMAIFWQTKPHCHVCQRPCCPPDARKRPCRAKRAIFEKKVFRQKKLVTHRGTPFRGTGRPGANFVRDPFLRPIDLAARGRWTHAIISRGKKVTGKRVEAGLGRPKTSHIENTGRPFGRPKTVQAFPLEGHVNHRIQTHFSSIQSFRPFPTSRSDKSSIRAKISIKLLRARKSA